MKIALAQLDLEIGDFDANLRRMEAAARRAQEEGCSLVLFPELAVCGYPPKDLLRRRDFVEQAAGAAQAMAASVGSITAIYGGLIPGPAGQRPWNGAYVARNGRVVAVARKMLLPAYDLFDEPRYFQPGGEPTWVELEGLRVGVTICEDLWNGEPHSAAYPMDPLQGLREAGIGLLVNISASPYDLGKVERRLEWLGGVARRMGVPLAYCNAVGGHDSAVFDGTSMVISPTGRLLHLGPSFSEGVVMGETSGEAAAVPPSIPQEPGLMASALVRGLADYLRRTGLERVVLGLSGGIDSSVCAVVAAEAAGPGNVLGVLMPSPFTSRESMEDALALAANLSLETRTIPIHPIMEAFQGQLAPSFAGLPRDVTEENLQARIRGNLLMALANKYGALLLATGNKSELAVGYCTLYGDMCGGYAPLADLVKTRVYELARWFNREREVIPRRVLEKPPTAELRPGQRDEDDLPPYAVLDRIVQGYVEEGLSPAEIARVHSLARGLVEEICARINRNEYKRWQAPPGPRVTRAAFVEGRRFPICHGYQVGP